jgi:hypothetical protein
MIESLSQYDHLNGCARSYALRPESASRIGVVMNSTLSILRQEFIFESLYSGVYAMMYWVSESYAKQALCLRLPWHNHETLYRLTMVGCARFWTRN